MGVAARDRLAVLAAEGDTTIRTLVEELAEGRPTRSAFEERPRRPAPNSPRSGARPSAEAEAKARTLLERLGASQDSVAA
ncbi:hypothetical protein [Streptomyces violascens]|uniref:hypothetical protein n=1 Tax=Streptomyces violascens TaxID=67381 RepID=UPI00364D87F9